MDVVVSHAAADFDSLGALVGATRLYPNAVPVLTGGAGPLVREFLSLHREFVDPRACGDLLPEAIRRVIVVDTCRRRRIGPAAAWLELPGVEVHLYDHHVEEECDLPVTQARVERWGAASSILADCLRSLGRTPTPFEATAMLLGIYEDTGSLSFAGT
ncbi:MAG: poly(A) polymerase, partial [Armatimonadetes bacterium]|nr:poly(A) polymerase [Armatimonadota bacterium]